MFGPLNRWNSVWLEPINWDPTDYWTWTEEFSATLRILTVNEDTWTWAETASAMLGQQGIGEDIWTWAETSSVSVAVDSSTTDAWTWTEAFTVGLGDAGYADTWTWAETGGLGQNDSSEDVWAWIETQTLSGLSVSASSADGWVWIESSNASRSASSAEIWTWAEVSSTNIGLHSSTTDTWTWAEVAASKLAMLAEHNETWTWEETPASVLGIALIDESTDEWVWIELYPTREVVYSFRVESMAATRYEAFPYQSAVQFGNRVLLAGRDGLFILESDTDSSSEILATIATGYDDFGTRQLKRADTLTLDADYSTEMTLTVDGRDPTNTSVEYPVVTTKFGKVKLARGQTFKRRKLTLVGPAPWELRAIDEFPFSLGRRSGGT